MMSVTVAVIGAGRMGSVVIKQLPFETKKIVIDSDIAKAEHAAASVGGKAYSNLEGVADADLIAVVLPAAAVNETVEKLMEIVKNGAVIINMATTVNIDAGILNRNKNVHVVDAKIIGHAASITRGEAGIIVAKTDDEKIYQLIKSQLPGFDDVVLGDADLVEKINTIGSTEGIKAAVTVRKQLRKMNIPDEWINVVIRSVCAGTMQSFTENDLGHFAMELVKKLEKEESQKGC